MKNKQKFEKDVHINIQIASSTESTELESSNASEDVVVDKGVYMALQYWNNKKLLLRNKLEFEFSPESSDTVDKKKRKKSS